jgi:H3 lysine-79-specific histone-lysine N-methyltransferase
LLALVWGERELRFAIFNDKTVITTKEFLQERNQKLKSRAAQLEKQIKVLIDDSVALLKARMSELGINASSPGDLLAKAKEIVLRHKELQAKASKLQAQVCVVL